MDYKVGDKIRILKMMGEPLYSGREGTITRIDDLGTLFGTWGGLGIILGEDRFEKIEPDYIKLDDKEFAKFLVKLKLEVGMNDLDISQYINGCLNNKQLLKEEDGYYTTKELYENWMEE